MKKKRESGSSSGRREGSSSGRHLRARSPPISRSRHSRTPLLGRNSPSLDPSLSNPNPELPNPNPNPNPDLPHLPNPNSAVPIPLPHLDGSPPPVTKDIPRSRLLIRNLASAINNVEEEEESEASYFHLDAVLKELQQRVGTDADVVIGNRVEAQSLIFYRDLTGWKGSAEVFAKRRRDVKNVEDLLEREGINNSKSGDGKKYAD